jgi:hypothetical protein
MADTSVIGGGRQELKDARFRYSTRSEYAGDRYGGIYTYVGRDATVTVSKDGKVITA